jgi:hypothetical protein
VSKASSIGNISVLSNRSLLTNKGIPVKQKFIRCTSIASVTVLAFVAAGCASIAVSGDAIEQNTAKALGLSKGSFTISDRVDDGVKSSYNVKTTAGKQYGCYVTGGISYVGRIVSDAVCTEVGKSAPAPAPGAAAPAASCNALLKAAGKC